jgi:hypothetical protein
MGLIEYVSVMSLMVCLGVEVDGSQEEDEVRCWD